MEWYPGKKVNFSDPSHDDEEESAILVADLQSSEFLSELESFVDAVRRFKSSLDRDDPRQVSDADLKKKAAGEAEILNNGERRLRKETIRRGTGKAQSTRKMRIMQTAGTLHQCIERTLPGVPPYRLACSRGCRPFREYASELRQEKINTHAVVMRALGGVGKVLLTQHPSDWKKRLKNLKAIDWRKSVGSDVNPLWDNVCITAGSVVSNRQARAATLSVLLRELEISKGTAKSAT